MKTNVYKKLVFAVLTLAALGNNVVFCMEADDNTAQTGQGEDDASDASQRCFLCEGDFNATNPSHSLQTFFQCTGTHPSAVHAACIKKWQTGPGRTCPFCRAYRVMGHTKFVNFLRRTGIMLFLNNHNNSLKIINKLLHGTACILYLYFFWTAIRGE